MDATRAATIMDEVLDFLVNTPTPQQIIDFHASEEVQMHVRDLLDRNRDGTLSDAEKIEMDEIGHIDHFIARLKVRAHKVLLKNDVHS